MMDRHKAFKALYNALLLKLLIIPVLFLVEPGFFFLYPTTLILDVLITVYMILYSKGIILKWETRWKNEMRKARIRRKEREEWLQYYRKARGYGL
ncbi:hypothetical protein [Marinilabilia salmonicolor]|uniref:hypothetical protein n=1 Tax=Marinilabilia salmonicolor TaxID=989 RepID=UPI00029AE199|nr:hypothetical protein [Marinilabilia salmonicolor]